MFLSFGALFLIFLQRAHLGFTLCDLHSCRKFTSCLVFIHLRKIFWYDLVIICVSLSVRQRFSQNPEIGYLCFYYEFENDEIKKSKISNKPTFFFIVILNSLSRKCACQAYLLGCMASLLTWVKVTDSFWGWPFSVLILFAMQCLIRIFSWGHRLTTSCSFHKEKH